jgi:striatin 1/3/4
MRFLQIEWHNHERARNSWEIEREEMKQKVSKDEGEIKKLKWQNEFLEKHVKMLESSLRAERAKSRALAAGDKSVAENEATKEAKVKAAVKLDPRSGKPAARRALLHALFMANKISHSSQQASQLLLERRGRLERVRSGHSS